MFLNLQNSAGVPIIDRNKLLLPKKLRNYLSNSNFPLNLNGIKKGTIFKNRAFKLIDINFISICSKW